MSLFPIDPDQIGGLNSGQLQGLLNYGQTMTARPNYRWQYKAGEMAKGLLGNQDLAMALLANSGYSPQKRSFGEILGTSALQAKQMGQERDDAAFKRRYMEAQIRNLDEPNRGAQTPNSVREYEYAKQNGFKGSFQEWIVAGGQTSRPSAVQEWEHYSKLMDEDTKNGTKNAQLYLEMKRNPNFAVKEVNQVPTSIQQSIVGGVTARPLSTLPQTAAAAETVKQAEGRGGAVGKTQGEITGGILTKGSNAKSVLGMLDEADKVIDQATGSGVGSAADKAAGLVGVSTQGAQAISKLKVLQAGLMLNMPRMEGPQSNLDVQLYREAAASLGEPDVPRATKKAALQQIRALQLKYAERAATLNTGFAPTIVQPQSGAPAQPTLDDIRKKYGRQP
jgi:hypothetical protein